MRPFFRLFLACALAVPVTRAVQPPDVAAALRNLREQRSYSWEIINGDPGPIAQHYETRRGTVSTVQQNLSPHVKGRLAFNGETLFQRDWPDGLQMDTVMAADGTTVTKTPEGWMTAKEVLDAIADERTRTPQPSDRSVWLRRADRPNLNRPDQELAPFIDGAGTFTRQGDAYTAHLSVHADGSPRTADEDDGLPTLDITITLNVRSGILRDYEVKVEGARNLPRIGIQLPINDDRIVIITNLPVGHLEIPAEAREKLDAIKSRRAAGE